MAAGRSPPAAARAATGKCSAAARAAAPATAETPVLKHNKNFINQFFFFE
jgi:hypothetical protein